MQKPVSTSSLSLSSAVAKAKYTQTQIAEDLTRYELNKEERFFTMNEKVDLKQIEKDKTHYQEECQINFHDVSGEIWNIFQSKANHLFMKNGEAFETNSEVDLSRFGKPTLKEIVQMNQTNPDQIELRIFREKDGSPVLFVKIEKRNDVLQGNLLIQDGWVVQNYTGKSWNFGDQSRSSSELITGNLQSDGSVNPNLARGFQIFFEAIINIFEWFGFEMTKKTTEITVN